MAYGDGGVFKRRESPDWYVRYRGVDGKEIKEKGLDKDGRPLKWKDPNLPEALSFEAHYQPGFDSERKYRAALRHLARRVHDVREAKQGGRAFVGPAQERLKVDDLLTALEKKYEANGKASPQFRSHLKPIRQHFGPLNAIALAQQSHRVDEYISELKGAGYEPTTINRRLQLLGQCYRLAVSDGLLSPNMVPRITHLSEKFNVRKDLLEPQDFEIVVSHLPSYLQDFARFAYLTGWRSGATKSLLWEDVDDEKIIVRAENEKNRDENDVPLRSEDGRLNAIGEVLEAARKRQVVTTETGEKIMCSHVFHYDADQRGRPLGDHRKAWISALEACGLPTEPYKRHRVHGFRRAAATNMDRNGVPRRVAMSITNHKTESMWGRYRIVSLGDKRTALSSMGTYIENAAKKKSKMAVMKTATEGV